MDIISDTGGDGSGEPSRYIAQWAHELVPASATTLERRNVAVNFALRQAPSIAVRKDGPVLEKLKAMAERGFSPSALGTWLRCPLDFYFSHVLRIRGPGTIDHKLGSDVLGEAVHGVLQEMLGRALDRELRPEELRQWAERARPELHALLAQDFPEDVLDRGHFRLRIDMAAKATADHLLAEADRVALGTRIVPLAVELDLGASLPNGVRIQGRCDRIDLRDGAVHVLDIKTGAVKEQQLRLKSTERSDLGAEQRYALQLLVYAWLYLMEHPEVDEVRAGILPLQRASQAEGIFLSIGGRNSITRDMLPEIGALLEGLTEELLDPEHAFMHDPDSEYCTCCVA
jgi:RecB family exonuclease